jgi:hypothetical protein
MSRSSTAGYTQLPTQMEREIEDMIDRHGLANVLDGIARICFDKADHIQANWQDAHLAGLWAAMANRLVTQSAAAAGKGL